MAVRVVVLLLIIAVISTALGVVYTQHESRKLFVELEQQRKKQDQLDAEWGRLQLEQGTLATPWRIESTARERLGMALPGDNEVVIVRP